MKNRKEDDDLIEVGFHMGLCPEYEQKDLLDTIDFISPQVKYFLILETEKGITYPYNRTICKGKYLLEAFDDDELVTDLKIKNGQVKKFIAYIENIVKEYKFLFDFSKEIGKEDFEKVITTGILISSVALEGELPGLASRMAFVAITSP
jgi:hypothetical protein